MTSSVLPIQEVRQELLQAVVSDQVVLVIGPTGSGKTTQIPQILLDGGFAKLGKIVCTEPRRIAAIASAIRVSEERNIQVGGEVGYQIRFEKQFGTETKLKFVTVGILLREAMLDSTLSEYSCVIVDEAHERDVFTDFLLGFLKRVCEQRPEFRVVVLSATLQAEEFLKYFPNANLVTIPSRQFSVEVKYEDVMEDELVEKIETMVRGIHYLYQKFGGNRDVLVFLPGERDIKQVIENLKKAGLEKFLPLPLYGRLAPREQRRIFEPFDGMKVIVATNVAESSITIEGVRYVIDTGTARTEGFDHVYGIETLTLEKISQSEAVQRAGRAGRTMPGTCYRLYSEADFNKRPVHRRPNILHSDLTSLVFCMKSLGFGMEFDFLTSPKAESWTLAEKQLLRLGAIDEEGQITEYGERIFRLPVQPRLAQFTLGSVHYGCIEESTTIAAMLSVGRFFVSEFFDEPEIERMKEKFRDPESDFFTLLNIWDDYVKSGYDVGWCELNHLNPYWMKGVHSIREQLKAALEGQGIVMSKSRSPEALGKAILSGFRSNLLAFSKGRNYVTENGLSHVSLFRDSVLAKRHPDYAVCFEIKRTTRIYAYCSHEIPKKWLADHSPATIDDTAASADDSVELVVDDALVDSFLKQSISELGLSDNAEMKLSGIGIVTILDLTKITEKRLMKELSELLATRGTRTGLDVIHEVKDRLNYFDLALAKDKAVKNSFDVDSNVLNLPPALPIDDERAAQVLGEQFPLFRAFRDAAYNYRRSKTDGAKWAMEEARNAIAVLHMGLVGRQARIMFGELQRKRDPALDFDDLVQEGCIGLLTSIAKFDYARGFRFSTYANWWIRQAIQRMLSDTSGLPDHMVVQIKKFQRAFKEEKQELGEMPTREHMAIKLDKPVEEIEKLIGILNFYVHFTSLDAPLKRNKSKEGDNSDSDNTLGNIELQVQSTPEDELDQTQIRDTVARIFDEVPFLDVEKECLELYFGLNGNDPHTLEEIGEYIGVSRERIRQRLSDALARLRIPRVYEMARGHIRTLQAPSTNKPAKSTLELGESASEIKRVRVNTEKTVQNELIENNIEDPQWEAMKIINSVVQHYVVSTEDVFGPSRKSEVVRARQVIMYRLREELGLSFPRIGEILSRDHATIMYGHSQVKSEVLSGIIPMGCFPSDPRTKAILAPEISEAVKKERLLDEILVQDIGVLGLKPKIEQILRKKRKAHTLKSLLEVGRDRLLMTETLDDESVDEIEAALRREGVGFAQ